MVQWLGLGAYNCPGPGSIPDGGTKIFKATRHSRKKTHRKQNKKDPRISFKLDLDSNLSSDILVT